MIKVSSTSKPGYLEHGMFVSHLKVRNWRNFPRIDVDLHHRQFAVGPNASGKSNLMDVFRFLRDIAKIEGGGLQKAVADRGGMTKIRNLSARRDPDLAIEVRFSDPMSGRETWRYELGLKQQARGYRHTLIAHERVCRNKMVILDRPNEDDHEDILRLTQTYLEQIAANREFRDIARFFQTITYHHMVPALLRHTDLIRGQVLEGDPYGQYFLEKVARETERTRKARLSRIEQVLKVVVPRLEQLEFIRDRETGRPHLQALYAHWRPRAGIQREDQFSDGTLRLIGMLWALFEGNSLLMLEEPELFLHAGIVNRLAALILRIQRNTGRQILISTHSAVLLSDPDIKQEEVLLLKPIAEGTEVVTSGNVKDALFFLERDVNEDQVMFEGTQPENLDQLNLFD